MTQKPTPESALRRLESRELLNDELVQVLNQRGLPLLPRLAVRARRRHLRDKPKRAKEAIEGILHGVFMPWQYQHDDPEKG